MNNVNTYKCKITIIVLLLAVLFVGLLLPLTSAQAESISVPTVINIPYVNTEGIITIDDNGVLNGIAVDFLKEIAKYNNWIYNYVKYDTPDQMMTDFLNKDLDYDIMCGAYYHESMLDKYGYPKYNIGYSRATLFALASNDDIKSYDLSTISNKKIGVYKNNANISRLEQYLMKSDITNCDIVKYDTGELFPYLKNGEVDLIFGSFSQSENDIRAVASFNASPMYLVTPVHKSDVLSKINIALEKVYESNPYFAEDSYDRNFPENLVSKVKLNAEELEYIAQNNIVSIAVPEASHPLYCRNNDDNWHNGILFDLMEKINEKIGLKYRFIESENFSSCVKLVQTGQADVAGIYLENADWAINKGLAVTNCYTNVSMTLVKNKKVTYPSSGLKMALIEGRDVPKNIDAEVVYYPNIIEALEAVNKGKVDMCYGISALIEQVIQENYLYNIVSVSFSESSLPVRFAMNSPATSTLFTILNKAIAMITNEEMSIIVSQNMGAIGKNGNSIRELFYNNPFVFFLIVGAFISLIFVIMLVVLLNRIHEARLKLTIAKSTADSKAKSEFLSRMSHEIRTPMNAVTGLTDLAIMQDDVPDTVRENLRKIRSSTNYLLSLLNDILDMSRIDGGMLKIAEEPFSISQMLDELTSMLTTTAEKKEIELIVQNEVAHDFYIGDIIRLKQIITNLVTNAIKFTPQGGKVTILVKPTQSGNIFFSVKDTGCGIAPEDQQRIFRAFEQLGNNVSRSQGTGLGLPISTAIVQLMGGELKVDSVVGKGSEFYFSIKLEKAESVLNSDAVIEEKTLENLRILLAEDNDLNAEIAQDILSLYGAVVKRVSNGKEATEEFEKNSENYDVILMDIQMPTMNGLEASKAIRNLNFERAKTIPIIAMTANSFQEDTDAAYEAGMDFFISKPIDTKLLNSVLKKIPKK